MSDRGGWDMEVYVYRRDANGDDLLEEPAGRGRPDDGEKFVLASDVAGSRWTPEQLAALKVMVQEWVNDGFTTPPYTDAQYDIFEAIGVESEQYDVTRPG